MFGRFDLVCTYDDLKLSHICKVIKLIYIGLQFTGMEFTGIANT